QKLQTCSCCQTIMYPGAENSPLNHKRSYCTDGVKQSQGLFSKGHTFYLHTFLLAVQCIYECIFMQGL
ncbi:hypothetical protein BDR05DRAFT_853827, partial [Suillus weaverae]